MTLRPPLIYTFNTYISGNKHQVAYEQDHDCPSPAPAPANSRVGPELNGIVGRKAASYADYTMYSAGMKKLPDSGWVWTEENIDKWITDPKAMIPDSTMAMAFQGIPDANERADIIAYLKTQ